MSMATNQEIIDRMQELINSSGYAEWLDAIVTRETAVGGSLYIDPLSREVPSGKIIAFFGTVAPTGWVACDGTNGTPDLRSRFVKGYISGTLGAAEAASFPAHTHTIAAASAIAYCTGTSPEPRGIRWDGGVDPVTTGAMTTSPGCCPVNICLMYCMKL